MWLPYYSVFHSNINKKLQAMEFVDYITTPKVDGVILHSPFHEPIDGTLCITGHHLILSSRKEDVQELWVYKDPVGHSCLLFVYERARTQQAALFIRECYARGDPTFHGHVLTVARFTSIQRVRISKKLLHQSIDLVDKKIHGGNANPNGGTLILKCKDLRILQLEISNTEELLNAYSSIERLSNLDRPDLLYPFFYRPMYSILEDGHTLFKPELEYAKLLTGDEWRISHVNTTYSVCPSYSATLIVPKSIDDDIIIAAATFRDGGRFPILSYRHDNGAVLMRSSQPLLNNNSRRSRADEKIMNAIVGNKKGYIIDTRSTSYTNQCKAKGGGTEPESHYTHWRKVHKGLDKISKCDGHLLDCFAKLIEASNDKNCSTDKWLSRLSNSNWLTHVQNALNASCLVAQCLDQEGTSVLVHGGTGLDSTLVVTSVAQVILNPDCRTVRGLQALIEREWLQAGHPFQTRHRKSCYSNSKSKAQQPTFLLFLDCIHQLYYQFPCSFEFKTQMLIILFEHSYYSQFGTFLGNCEAERKEIQISKKTTSLWSYLNRPDVITSLLNPMYDPNKQPIWPSVAAVSLVLWEELYFRWTLDQSANKRAMVKVQELIEEDKELRSQALRLRKQLTELYRQYEALKKEVGSDTESD